jgi:hypothetical protein
MPYENNFSALQGGRLIFFDINALYYNIFLSLAIIFPASQATENSKRVSLKKGRQNCLLYWYSFLNHTCGGDVNTCCD